MIVLELGQVGCVAVCDELQRSDRGKLLSVLRFPKDRVPFSEPRYLALLLQLLGGSAHNVDVHGGQADGVIDCHILGGAVGRMRAQVQLWTRQPWAQAGPSDLPSLPSPPNPHLRDEQLQKVSLVPQWVVHQAVTEGHHTVREIVLSQPCHHPLLLHVGSAGHIDDEVAQVLPVSVEARGRHGVPWLLFPSLSPPFPPS